MNRTGIRAKSKSANVLRLKLVTQKHSVQWDEGLKWLTLVCLVLPCCGYSLLLRSQTWKLWCLCHLESDPFQVTPVGYLLESLIWLSAYSSLRINMDLPSSKLSFVCWWWPPGRRKRVWSNGTVACSKAVSQNAGCASWQWILINPGCAVIQ